MAVSVENTVRKVGAHLRWLLEKSGVDAEAAHVMIGVRTVDDRRKLLQHITNNFDEAVMSTATNDRMSVRVHGVLVSVGVIAPPPKQNA